MSWIELEPLLCWIGILALLAVSLNVITGMTGLLQLGHAGFFAAGAYAAGLFAIHASVPALGPLNFIFGAASAVLAACLLSLAIGVPCLRLRGDYLAVATLGFGEIMRLVLTVARFPGGRMHGGAGIGEATGISFTDSPEVLWPDHPGYAGKFATWWLIWLIVAASYVLLLNIKRSRAGRAFMCIREDEIAARSMGINVPRFKIMAFLLSAGFAGLAGALFFHHQLRVNPGNFTLMTSISVLLMVVLGGMGSLSGSILAAVVLGVGEQALRHFKLGEYHQLLYAGLLIVLIRLAPDGLMGRGEVPGWLLAWRRGAAGGKGVD